MRVSIVIPAYNEESHLRACLQAIAEQTVKPFEVIVVDNNSTDATASVARSFPFVTLVHEEKQGIVHARNRGFDMVCGDVIGRIDADTIISKEWIARAEVLFDRSDVDAVSGVIGFYDTPFKPFADQLDRLLRAYLVRRLQTRHELLLQGSNMAIRRSAWQTVRLSLCDNASFHEDVDLAAHLAHQKYDVRFDPSLQVMVSARRIDSDMQSFRAYAWANSRTYAAHHLKGRFYMYPIQIFGVMLHLPLRFLYRMYNPVTHQISFKRALRHHADRRPASVIDVV